MAELATIARPYADALYKAAGSDATAWLPWLEELAAVVATPELKQFAADPNIADQQIIDLIVSVMKSPAAPACASFLNTLVENNRLLALAEIAKMYRNLVNERDGSSDAEIFSAFPIEGTELADLVTSLEKRFARKLNVQVRHDASLIGGVRVVVGDEVLDTSVKARLEQMKVVLTA
ncbi:F0F1 ATP synthase subunit delta [Curvibacter sp. CHRR-16]|uniref:F0F1 ATP synthase subunit delta n=1 Tax=Curvibacter sp. CHRR-16 TaxID=2835872 RepID=UPI001BD968D1|nr:F0F1 ATP synthase subunit delta [Curvibacter sp. CHRR-16]MBT0571828.1 F0F1 ATP synthase subunit delta [Curvibacter sp. CHRR-16]